MLCVKHDVGYNMQNNALNENYIELCQALGDQIKYLPVAEHEYYYNRETKLFFSVSLNRHLKMSGSNRILHFKLRNKCIKQSMPYSRLICFLDNGLEEGMQNINDKRFLAINSPQGTLWMTMSDYQQSNSIQALERLFKQHPELKIKDGFYDEGLIEFKERPGFFFVPETKGTVAINPLTAEVVFTYSNTLLKTRTNHRGYSTFTLNVRIVGRHSMFLHRALAYVTVPLPIRYRKEQQSLRDAIAALDVDHKDGNTSNNDIGNLQYLTHLENVIKAVDQGFRKNTASTVWKSPEGIEIFFESLKRASKQIKCSVTTLSRYIFDWRNREVTINGWKLLIGKQISQHESLYQKLENLGVKREHLVRLNVPFIIHIFTGSGKYKVEIYENLHVYSRVSGISINTLEAHLYQKGPLTPLWGKLMFPLCFHKQLLQLNYLDTITL